MSVTFDGSTPFAAAPGEPPTSSVLCWETWRLRATLPKIVSRAMSFSALPRFDTALVAAVQRFYGIDVDVATAETEILEDDLERVRFFPWFLWDWPMAETPTGAPAADPSHEAFDPDDAIWRVTVGRRFLAEGDLEPIEARLLEALCESTIGFAEVLSIDGPTLLMRDLSAFADAGPITLEDATLAREVVVGALLQARFLRVGDIGLVDTIYAVLPLEMRPVVTAELDRIIGDAPDRAVAVARLKAHAPDLLEFAEHLLEGLERPEVPVADDGEALVLCATVLTGSNAEALCRRLMTDAALPSLVPSTTPGIWRIGDIGFIDARHAPTRVLLGASTRTAMTALRAALMAVDVPLPVLQSEEDFPRAAAGWVERGHAGPWLDGDPAILGAFRAWFVDWSRRWVDAPHPQLGRSPREAARDPLGRSAVVELLRRMQLVAGDTTAETIETQLGLGAAR